jgi:hypothetical protein
MTNCTHIVTMVGDKPYRCHRALPCPVHTKVPYASWPKPTTVFKPSPCRWLEVDDDYIEEYYP